MHLHLHAQAPDSILPFLPIMRRPFLLILDKHAHPPAAPRAHDGAPGSGRLRERHLARGGVAGVAIHRVRARGVEEVPREAESAVRGKGEEPVDPEARGEAGGAVDVGC